MQVFVPYRDPIKVAECLDIRRLNKQIIECNQILRAIHGNSRGWKNHPVVKMYSAYKDRMWLINYRATLEAYKSGDYKRAILWSEWSKSFTPNFLTKEFCNQHKRRLYTKSPEDYPQFVKYGTSEENWYYVNGELVKYINGTKTITTSRSI